MCARAVPAWLRADAPHAARPLTRRREWSLPDSSRCRVTSTTPPGGRQTWPRGTQDREHQARASAGAVTPVRAPLASSLSGGGPRDRLAALGRGQGLCRPSAPVAPGRVPQLQRHRAVACFHFARGASRYPIHGDRLHEVKVKCSDMRMA